VESFARMAELRTPKVINGLDFGCPSLSVQRWYRAAFGEAAWDSFENIPRAHWAAYLRWYRATLDLPVRNDTEAVDVFPAHGVIGVRTQGKAGAAVLLARTVVLATGYDGAGAWAVPEVVSAALPPDRYDHTNGPVDFAKLRGRRVAVLGHGASAFDNANAALAAGAARVDLCFRRDRLPRINPHRFMETAGTMTHFCALPDAVRWRVLRYFKSNDQPPPLPTFERAMAHENFRLHPATPWLGLRLDGDAIAIATPRGELCADHVLCGTGSTIALEARPELRRIAAAVLRWRDRFVPPPGRRTRGLPVCPIWGSTTNACPPIRPMRGSAACSATISPAG